MSDLFASGGSTDTAGASGASPDPLILGVELLEVTSHLLPGVVGVTGADRHRNATVVLVDGAVGSRQQVEVRAEELRQVVDRRERDVAAAARALRGADQVLRSEDAERFADGRPADAELACEVPLVRKPLAGRELSRRDQVAQLLGDLLARLDDPSACDPGGVRWPLTVDIR